MGNWRREGWPHRTLADFYGIDHNFDIDDGWFSSNLSLRFQAEDLGSELA
jgi:hypothetical protein